MTLELGSKAMTIAVVIACTCSFLLPHQIFSQSYHNTDEHENVEWLGAPSLEAFASYEDMQRYIESRNSRGIHSLANPSEDSYIHAYNQHNENPSSKLRPVRSARSKLLSEPQMIKFELSDAREPDDEVKELIKRYRGKELRPSNHHDTKSVTTERVATIRKAITPAADEWKDHIKAKVTTRSDRGRTKRLAHNTPQMIAFEESDAREPDAATKELINKMRSLALKQSAPLKAASTTSTPTARPGRLRVKLQRKRSRRSALQTPPRMIKFEIEDAKVPDESTQNLLKTAHGRELRDTKDSLRGDGRINKTNVASKKADVITEEDQDKSESKRFYFYQEAPKTAVKMNSIHSLPQEVQKAISHILKDNKGARAYVKYIPAQEIQNHRVPKSHSEGYSGGGSTFVRYIEPAPLHTAVHVPVQAVHVPLHATVQVPIHAVATVQEQVHPVIEKIHYVLTPTTTSGAGSSHPPTSYLFHGPPAPQEVASHVDSSVSAVSAPINEELSRHEHVSQPIVVAEQQHEVAELTPVVHHHAYAANGHIEQTAENHAAVPEQHVIFKDITGTAFKPSPVDTQEGVDSKQYVDLEAGGDVKGASGASHLEGNSGHGYGVPTEGTGKYSFVPHYQQEQQQQQKHIFGSNQHQLQHYKDLREFKELSALIGKSPEDQIHGLTYLLAKEMQHNLKLQRQQNQLQSEEKTSPVLFQPSSNGGHGYGQLGAQSKGYTYGESGGAKFSNSLDGLYGSRTAQHNSGTSYQSIGLSPNYEGFDKRYPNKQNTNLKAGLASPVGADLEDGNGLQYASKYAFGYRIRDFNTGNDFGHKQNRDLDGVTRGQYHILLPDGRIQNVIYHADDTGFHADVSFETGH